jgi:hypothetical protein
MERAEKPSTKHRSGSSLTARWQTTAADSHSRTRTLGRVNPRNGHYRPGATRDRSILRRSGGIDHLRVGGVGARLRGRRVYRQRRPGGLQLRARTAPRYVRRGIFGRQEGPRPDAGSRGLSDENAPAQGDSPAPLSLFGALTLIRALSSARILLRRRGLLRRLRWRDMPFRGACRRMLQFADR